MTTPRPDPSPRARRARDRLLDALCVHGSATRVDLAERLGLAVSSVNATVTALLADGAIVETPVERGGRGRRAGVLSLAPRPDGYVLGIDIGHRHVAVAVGDTASTVLAQRRAIIDVDHDAQGTLDLAAELSRAVLDDAGTPAAALSTVAACMPTTLEGEADDGTTGSWHGVSSARSELSRWLDRPVVVVNDADAGLLGEVRSGAARGYRDVLYVKASHGVGAAYLLDGKPYRGSRGLSGEIGHVRVPSLAVGADAPWCRCGNQGCLETAVSIDVVDERTARARRSFTGSPTQLEHIERRILVDAGQTLGRVLAALATALNPALLVVGGELAARHGTEDGSPLVDGVRDAVAEYALPAIAASLEIRRSGLGSDAELRGVLVAAAGSLSS